MFNKIVIAYVSFFVFFTTHLNAQFSDIPEDIMVTDFLDQLIIQSKDPEELHTSVTKAISLNKRCRATFDKVTSNEILYKRFLKNVMVKFNISYEPTAARAFTKKFYEMRSPHYQFKEPKKYQKELHHLERFLTMNHSNYDARSLVPPYDPNLTVTLINAGIDQKITEKYKITLLDALLYYECRLNPGEEGFKKIKMLLNNRARLACNFDTYPSILAIAFGKRGGNISQPAVKNLIVFLLQQKKDLINEPQKYEGNKTFLQLATEKNLEEWKDFLVQYGAK